ncbi:MAG: hypothetical protein ACXWWA_09985 [Chitinophagaceae bacterium]
MSLIKRLKSGWTLVKFIRIGLGSLILYSSIQSGHIAGIIAGSLFTLVSLLTDGVCCTAAGSCNNPGNKNTSSTHKKIEYEELGSK